MNRIKYLEGIVNSRKEIIPEIIERIANTGKVFNTIKSDFSVEKKFLIM